MGEESKAWWQSRTIIGVIVMLLAQVLKLLKVDIVNEELTAIVTLAMEAAGAALAIVGRIKARKAIKRTTPGGPFNPRAEVRRAKRSKGTASVTALGMVVAVYGTGGAFFLMEWPKCDLWVRQSSPMICYRDRVDERPFLKRLIASLRYNPISGEITGGAEF